MKDIQTEIECINMRVELLNEESQNLYKLLENFEIMEGYSIDDVRQEVLRQLEKRKREMKNELETLSQRVKKLSKQEIS